MQLHVDEQCFFTYITYKSDLKKHVFELTLILLRQLVGHAMVQRFVLV